MPGKQKDGRQVVPTGTATFLPYDLEGPVQPEMSWLPISYDRASQRGSIARATAERPGCRTLADHDMVFARQIVRQAG